MKKPGKMLSEVLKSLFKKPATLRYPYIKEKMPKNFRGLINFIPEKCIGCKICMRDCPANVINIIKIADKKFEAEFKNDQCLFCAQCVESCPRDTLEVTPEYELATLDRSSLKVRYHAKPDAETKTEPQVEIK